MGRPAAVKATQRMIRSVILVLFGIKKMSAADSRSTAGSTETIFIKIFHESAVRYRYRPCRFDP